jgi:hypothetical protein
MRHAKFCLVLAAAHLFACAPTEPQSRGEEHAAQREAVWLKPGQLIDAAELFAGDAEEDDADQEGIRLQPSWEPLELCASDAHSGACLFPQRETELQLFVHFPDDTRPLLCKGWRVGADAVLTSAHCVYDDDRGGAALAVRAVGQRVATFGMRLFVPHGYRNASDVAGQKRHDYAVVRMADRLAAAPSTHHLAALMPARDLPRDLARLYEDELTHGTLRAWVGSR